jgi:hypothetical protein
MSVANEVRNGASFRLHRTAKRRPCRRCVCRVIVKPRLPFGRLPEFGDAHIGQAGVYVGNTSRPGAAVFGPVLLRYFIRSPHNVEFCFRRVRERYVEVTDCAANVRAVALFAKRRRFLCMAAILATASWAVPCRGTCACAIRRASAQPPSTSKRPPRQTVVGVSWWAGLAYILLIPTWGPPTPA